MNLIINGLRTIFGFIDKCVYSLVEGVFQLIIDLANVEIFSGSQINDFANRIYIILGLVMIFKLMISFIQIIINPDKMDDKEQGVGNILKRVIISLALIVLVPSIFDMARTIQEYIIPIIPKVILGRQTADVTGQNAIQDAGRVMAYQSFLSFYGYDNPSCRDGSISGIGPSDPAKVTIASIDAAVAPSNLNMIDACSNDPNGYKYKYVILASTALAVYLLYTLVSMAVYVAIRAIKLALCELIAPIPIASYIDPKTSKQSFDNWVKTSFSTYLDLFVNLIGVYFIAYVFSILVDKGTVTTIYSKVGQDYTRAAWVTVFIIIALLKFGKEFPKFITGLLGIKEGSGNLSGILKGAGSLLGGTIGTATGGIGNIANQWRHIGHGGGVKAFGKGLISGAAGMTSGMWSTAKNFTAGKGGIETLKNVNNGIAARRNQRAAEKAAGVGFVDRQKVKVQDYFQIANEVSLAEGRQKAVSAGRSDVSNIKSVSKTRIHEKEPDIGFNRASSKILHQVEQIIEDDAVGITKSGNDSLINFVRNKFEKNKTTGKLQLKAGASLNVRELDQFAKLASQEKLMSGFQLSDSRFVDAMDKELIEDMTMGRAKHGDGITDHESFNRNGSNVHADIVGALNQFSQDIQTNIADLGEITLKGVTDPATGKDWVLRTAEDYQKAVENGLLLKVDEALQQVQNETREKVATNTDAAARAANEKRKQNSKP